jgi:hypothetical protein
VLEPGLDVEVQQIGAIVEPALALGREREQTSLKRRKAPLPSIATSSRSRNAGPDTTPRSASIQRYCSRDEAGSTRR